MTIEQPMRTVIRDADKLGLRYERHLNQPAEKGWRALTESEHLRHWFPADIVGDRTSGATIELPFWEDHVEQYDLDPPVLHGKIEVWEPVSVFQFTWETEVVRFDLEPIDGGTRLIFTAWLGAGEQPADAANAAAGYHVCLGQLVRLVETGSTGLLIEADVSPWERRYSEAVTAALE